MNLKNVALATFETFDLTGLKVEPNLAIKTIENDLIEDFNDLNSEETLNARFHYFQAAGTRPSDYEERVLVLDEGREILYGIRHLGGNKNLPFVSLIPNFQITDRKEALEIYRKTNLDIFQLKYLGFWSAKNKSSDFVGSIYMLSSSREVKNIKPWPQEKRISFHKILDDSFYEWYLKEYEEFHNDWSILKDKVRPNDLKSMMESILYYVHLDDERIGLIEAVNSDFLGHKGFYFNEILVSRKWKGQGLAKAIQRKFIESFTQDDEFIWGTIDSNNLPSYKTALANGRRPVRFECFVNID